MQNVDSKCYRKRLNDMISSLEEISYSMLGRRLAQRTWVRLPARVHLLHVTPPLSLIVSCHIFSWTINKAIKGQKKTVPFWIMSGCLNSAGLGLGGQWTLCRSLFVTVLAVLWLLNTPLELLCCCVLLSHRILVCMFNFLTSLPLLWST